MLGTNPAPRTSESAPRRRGRRFGRFASGREEFGRCAAAAVPTVWIGQACRPVCPVLWRLGTRPMNTRHGLSVLRAGAAAGYTGVMQPVALGDALVTSAATG